YTSDETVGKDTNLLKSGEHPAAFYREMWTTLQQGEIWHGELINRHKDGSHYIEEQVITPIKNNQGEITHYVAVKQDITARREREETIRKLSQAVEQSASTIVITDLDGNIEYANPAFSKVTGYSIDEALGQNPRILKSGKMPPEFYQEMWETLIAGEIWSGEMINKKKNGELYWEFATIAPVKDENGKTTHYIAIKDDITARKQMEDELRIARDQALEANRLKSRILANISHDMRTPLGSILGYTDMLQAEVFGPLNDTQQDKLNLIIKSSNHLLEFVSNLLTQSELEAGQLELQANQISLPELKQELEEGIRVLAAQKGLQLTGKLDPALPETIIGDRYWLRRIIANLLNNAIKFTEQGQVGLSFARVDEDHWKVEVSDTGSGFHPKSAAKFSSHSKKGATISAPQAAPGWGWQLSKRLSNKWMVELRSRALSTRVAPSLFCCHWKHQRKKKHDYKTNCPYYRR
ncbi:MAG TPA: PAS domain S-box protein, partial [Anaerolineales bacterium]|nr:PAS domain S-box protein [Anaerolineales bacterium]